jgi:hypothetical protein
MHRRDGKSFSIFAMMGKGIEGDDHLIGEDRVPGHECVAVVAGTLIPRDLKRLAHRLERLGLDRRRRHGSTFEPWHRN